jgi:2-polyprenyl-3-methyl-5-hydroxy-6-metoxy-1,4-benzoquinol methylase
MEETKRIVPFEEKIAIGLPTGSDKFNFETVESLLKMLSKSPCNFKFINSKKVHHIARNEIFKEFLKSDMNYLLTIDSDMIWEPDSLELAYQLIQHPDVDIVTGIYFTKGAPYLPVIKKLDLQAGCYNIYTQWGNEPFEVDGAGMGFMLIKRKVVEALKQPICTWDGGFSEDLNFCLKAKKDFGFRIWAHPKINLGHIGQMIITSVNWAMQYKPAVEAYIAQAMAGTTNYLQQEYPNWRELLGIHPLQFKNVNTEKYWDEVYKREGLRNTWRTYPEKYDHIAKEVLKEQFELKPNSRVLELGCGVGIFASKLRESYPQVDYYGVDISEEAIKALKNEGFEGEAKQIPPIGLDTRDVVLGFEILEHLDEEPRLQTIKEVSEIIGDNGIAVFSLPDNILGPEDLAEHRVKYTAEEFEKFLKQAFKNVKVEQVLTRISDKPTLGKAPFLVGVCDNKPKKK